MKLEDQVVSLELAKKLKELGVKQESLFWWNPRVDDSMGMMCRPSSLEDKRIYWEINTYEDDFGCQSYTAAELWTMLPWCVKNETTRNVDTVTTGKNADAMHICCYHTSFSPPLIEFIEPTEADARAKVLIYLLENKLFNHETIT